MDLAEIRRQNLRNLRTKIGARRIAATLPLDQVETLAAVCKAKSLVEPADAFVRAVEKAFYLAPGCLDAPAACPRLRRPHLLHWGKQRTAAPPING